MNRAIKLHNYTYVIQRLGFKFKIFKIFKRERERERCNNYPETNLGGRFDYFLIGVCIYTTEYHTYILDQFSK